MVERGINLDHVKAAVKDPDTKEDVFDGKIKVTKEINNRLTIEVIYCIEKFKDKPNEYLLITAYYK
jgi:hypothetical protein